jgi:hypothetical protein
MSRPADGLGRLAAAPAAARPGARGTLEIARAVWGAVLLIGPGFVLEHVHGVRADSRSVAVIRVLGARHVAQAVLSGIRPSPAVLALGIWADAAHAGTGLVFAAADRARARAALIDAAVAVGWAATGLYELTGSRPPQPVGQWRRDRLARGLLRHLPAGRSLLARAGPPCP